jgi:hypothetical protein
MGGKSRREGRTMNDIMGVRRGRRSQDIRANGEGNPLGRLLEDISPHKRSFTYNKTTVTT